MRTSLILSLFALACASPPGVSVDAAPIPDASSFLVPECRPLSEQPGGCSGDCTALYPLCPAGFTPVCGALARWQSMGSSCSVQNAYIADACVDGELPDCPGSFVWCLPPSRTSLCPVP